MPHLADKSISPERSSRFSRFRSWSKVNMIPIIPNPVGKSTTFGGFLPLTYNSMDTKKILRDNVWALMVDRYGKPNQTRLVKEAKVGTGTLTRIDEGATAIGLDVLEKIADALGVKPWQLLAPNLDPKNLPVILSPLERDFYKKMSAAAKELTKNAG